MIRRSAFDEYKKSFHGIRDKSSMGNLISYVECDVIDHEGIS